MGHPSVRAVHRITLDTDGHGRITARRLMDVPPLPPGAVVVLECGSGWWINQSDLAHILRALSCVEHITVSGIHESRKGGVGHFGLIYGLDAIADRLAHLIANPPLFEPV